MKEEASLSHDSIPIPMAQKVPRDKQERKRSSQNQPSTKLKRLREKIQELDLVLSDVKHYAADFCLDEFVQSKAESSDYRRPSRPQDWGKEIDKKSFVYFIFCPQVSAIKIGYTKDLRSRISALQTGNPCRLKMLAWMEGGRSQEATLHNFFQCYHAGIGEWFFYEGDLFDYVLAAIRHQPAYLDPHDWMQDEKCQSMPSDLIESMADKTKVLREADAFLSESRTIPLSPSFQDLGLAIEEG